jgi:competence protein ComEA
MNEEFYLSKKTKRAMIIFIALLCIISFVPRFLIYLFPHKPIQVTIREKKIFNQIKYTSYQKYNKKEYKKPPQKFDPNSYTIQDWMYLGLTEKQAKSVLKFGKYGFYSNEQLAKVFVIPKEVYNLIKDSTYYPVKSKSDYQHQNFEEKIVEKQKNYSVELNSASEDDLLKIKGIGPFFASNIIRQREKLGGFVSKQQLLEVWRFTPEKLDEIEKNLEVNVNNIRKLNINTVTVEELKNHPYISWNIANSIIKMRMQKQQFSSLNELLESKVITQEVFEKIKPYLTL